MTTKMYFARNADGSIKRKQPCPTPGCNYPNEHLCFHGKADTMTAAIHRDALRGPTTSGRAMPEWQKAEIAESQRKRHAARRRKNLERDLEIQRRYLGGATKSALAREFGITKYTLESALRHSRADHE